MAHARKDYYAVLTQPVPVRTKARVCDAVAFGWCPDALSFEAGTTIRFQLGVASPPLAEKAMSSSSGCSCCNQRKSGDELVLQNVEGPLLSQEADDCFLHMSPANSPFRMLLRSDRCAGGAAG